MAFGTLYDVFGFQRLFYILMALNMVCAAVAYPARKIEALYFLCVQLNYFVIAGIFATFPTPGAQTFGKRYGAQVYSLIVIGSVLASPVNYIFVEFLQKPLGILPLFIIGGGCSLLAMVLNYFFSE